MNSAPSFIEFIQIPNTTCPQIRLPQFRK